MSSTYEGKNIFRNVLSQKPVFSGNSNIIASRVNVSHLFEKMSQEEKEKIMIPTAAQNDKIEVDITTVAFGSTLNIVNRKTGTTILSREVGLEDDVILNIDAIVAPSEIVQDKKVTEDGDENTNNNNNAPKP